MEIKVINLITLKNPEKRRAGDKYRLNILYLSA